MLATCTFSARPFPATVRFTRAGGTFTTQDRERAGLLAKRLGLTVELAG